MSYTVDIAATYSNVTVVSTSTAIIVSTDGSPTFNITATTFTVASSFTVSTVTVYTDAVELLVDDFANYFRGDWVNGQTYRRGELVNYEYSLFVCNTGTNTTLVSTVSPPQAVDYDWRRVVWNEAPRNFLTITNDLTVGDDVSIGDQLTVAGLATFNGTSDFNGLTRIDGELDVNSAADFSAAVRVTGEFTASGSVTLGTVGAGSVNIGSGALVVNSTTATFSVPVQFNNTVSTTDQIVSGIIRGTPRLQLSTSTVNGEFTTTDVAYVPRLYITGALRDPITADVGLDVNESFIRVRGNSGRALITADGNITSYKSLVSTEIAYLNSGLDSNGASSFEGGDVTILNNQLRVTSNATFRSDGANTFNAASTFNAPATVNSLLTAQFANITGTLTNRTQVFPSSTGTFGQVLAVTNYTGTQLGWRNLGDLTFWSLTSDLLTNGYDIKTGYDAITFAAPELSIIRADNVQELQSVRMLGTAGDRRLEIFSTGTVKLHTNNDNKLIISQAGTTAYGTWTFNNQVIVSSSGIKFSDGTVQTTAGGGGTSTGITAVYAGEGIAVASSGTGVIVSQTTASTTQVGGIKLGTGLAYQGDGTVAVTTGTFALQTATNLILGGVKRGTGLRSDSDGTINLATATSISLGGIKVGNNLTIDSDGTLNASGTIDAGAVSLTQDMNTNGYKIRNSAGSPNSYVDVNTQNIEINTVDFYVNTASVHRLTVDLNSAKIEAYQNSTLKSYVETDYDNGLSQANVNIYAYSKINLTTPQEINITGDDINLTATSGEIVTTGTFRTTNMRAAEYRNQAGTGPAYFPAGIQFGDQTVQITAFDDQKFDNGYFVPTTSNSIWALINQVLNVNMGTFLNPATYGYDAGGI